MTELDVALEAAVAAHAIQRTRGPGVVRHKGATDLVTEVDLACEAAIRDVIARHTPDVPVLGEEGGGAADATTRWVVDPLDGTTNFVHGFPSWSVSIALEIDGVSEVGVVIDGVRGTVYSGRRGHGAFADGHRLRVSDCRDLGDALVGTGFPYDRRLRAEHVATQLAAVLRRARDVRRAGAATLDLAFLAAGHLDAFWELSLAPWDVAASRLFILEAGGWFTGHDGGAVDRLRPSPLATNGWLHDAMMEALAGWSGL